MLCLVSGVRRSGFYAYLRRQDRDPGLEHEEKLELVKKSAEASDHTYGSRRMWPRHYARWGIGRAAIRPVA